MADSTDVLFDVNALVALTLTTHQHHRAAHRYLADLNGGWGTCPITEAGVLRLLLNPAVTGSPRSAGQVLRVIAGFRVDPRWRFYPDASTLAAPQIDTSILMGHQQVTDLVLINLAATHAVRLATFDAGIARWLAPSDRRHLTLIPA